MSGKIRFRLFLTLLIAIALVIPTITSITLRYGTDSDGVVWLGLLEQRQSISQYQYIVNTTGTTVFAINTSTMDVEFSGTNDSSVIQSCVNALPNIQPGKILIKKGRYEFLGVVRLKHGVEIEGEGRDNTLLVNMQDGVFRFNGNTDQRVVIRNFDMSDNNVDSPLIKLDSYGAGSGIRNVVIADCYIHSAGTNNGGRSNAYGIWANSSYSMWIENCDISYNENGGIYLDRNGSQLGCQGTTIVNCWILQNHDGPGIRADRTAGLSITDCVIQSNRYGVVLDGTYAANIRGGYFENNRQADILIQGENDEGDSTQTPNVNIVSGCYFNSNHNETTNKWHCNIKVNGTLGAQQHIFEDSYFESRFPFRMDNNISNGMTIRNCVFTVGTLNITGCSRFNIEDVHFRKAVHWKRLINLTSCSFFNVRGITHSSDHRANGVGGVGIQLDNCFNGMITECNLLNMGSAGIMVIGSDNISVTNNIVRQSVDPVFLSTIYLNWSDYCMVSGNTMESLYAASCQQLIVNGNQMQGAGDLGVLLAGGGNNMVSNNIISKCTDHAIQANGGNTTINNNIIRNGLNNAYGIRIRQTGDDYYVAGNIIYGANQGGISLENSCDNVILVNNNVRGCGATMYNNATTGTHNIVWGNNGFT